VSSLLVDTFTLQTRADQQPKNPQPVFLSQSRELFDPLIHYYISSIIEIAIMQATYSAAEG
jgi:hypothetical protein